MKKNLFFACAMMAAMAMNAQTIVVDGNNAEWATVPMITEPGVNTTVLKYLVPQEGANIGAGNAFAVMLQTDKEVAGDKPVTIYVDADKSSATGQQTPWFIKSMYRDYELGITDSGDGITGAVRSTNATDGIIELTMPTSAMSSPAFTGSFWASFSYNWGNFYVPNSPEPSGDNWLWGEAFYQPTNVAPYTYAAMPGKHLFKDTYARHQCVALADSMNFAVSGGSQDTAFWCAWTVEVKGGTTYAVSADMVSYDHASCDLYLVDVATNKVVASFQSDDFWAPTGETALGNWDLTAVTPGKYMLKMKNRIAWSHMKLVSVTLTGDEPEPTSLGNTKAAPQAVKVMKDNSIVIERNNVRYNVLGTTL